MIKFAIMDENTEREILELRNSGASCGEATLTGLARILGLPQDEDELRALALPFRGGIGATFADGPCGALTGAVMALGLAARRQPKMATAGAARLYDRFKDEFGTISCGAMHHKGREHCNKCCLAAARMTLEIMEDNGITAAE